ncbi:MAG: hypothetical protein ACRC1Z_12310 [Waterburya sp.]
MKETEYQKLVNLLDDLIDEVGEDGSHPLASCNGNYWFINCKVMNQKMYLSRIKNFGL